MVATFTQSIVQPTTTPVAMEAADDQVAYLKKILEALEAIRDNVAPFLPAPWHRAVAIMAVM